MESNGHAKPYAEEESISKNDTETNVTYNDSRVIRFKSEIYNEILNLLSNGDTNPCNKEYIQKVFDNNSSQNHNTSLSNNTEQPEQIEADNKLPNGNVISSKLIKNIEAYAVLEQILLNHEFQMSKMTPYQWFVEFSNEAMSILELYAKSKLIEEPFISYAKWIAFVEIHQLHPLNPEIFEKLFNNLICEFKETPKNKSRIKKLRPKLFSKKVQAEITFMLRLPQDDEKENVANLFWESTNKLFDSFLDFIQDLHFNSRGNEGRTNAVILEKFFKLVEKIESLNDSKIENFSKCVEDSLIKGTTEHFNKNVDYTLLGKSEENMMRLEELIKILKFTKNNIKEFDKHFGRLFDLFLENSSAKVLYTVYDTQLVKILQPIILEICDMSKEKFKTFNKEDEDILKKVFELYSELNNFKNFVTKALKIQDFSLKNCTDWFLAGIESWREASMLTVLFRIEKSIEIDKLKPEFDNVKYTSSVIDAMQILYSTKNFWEHLQWFDNKVDLVNEITLDLCQTFVLYLEKFVEKVQKSEMWSEKNFKNMIAKLSLITNNYNYGSEKFQTLIEEFIKNKNISDTAARNSIEKTEKKLKDKIFELISADMKSLHAEIKKMIIENAKNNKTRKNVSYDDLIMHVEDIVIELYKNLPDREFQIAKSVLFKEIIQMVSDIVKAYKRKPIEFFVNIRNIFDTLKHVFNISVNEASDDVELFEKIERIDYLLESYEQATSELIHRFYKDRYKLQKKSINDSISPFGILTICCNFVDDKFKIEVLNAKNLTGNKTQKKVDSYVKVNIIPENNFKNFKTKIQQNTNFPSYDEVFEFTLSKEPPDVKDVIICFKVKEKKLIRGRKCVSEAFLALEDISEYVYKENQQIELPLTKLKISELDILRVIKYKSRTGDKMAKEFLTKLNKLPSVH